MESAIFQQNLNDVLMNQMPSVGWDDPLETMGGP